MPRRSRDLVATIAALLVLFGVLVWVSPQVRERVTEFTGNSQEWVVPGNAVTTMFVSATGWVSTYASDNTYLFSFLVVAVVLFVLMVRA